MPRFRPIPTIFAAALIFSFSACEDNDISTSLRAPIDYATLDVATPYAQQFLDADGASTVDVKSGNDLHKMFQSINYNASASISGNLFIDATRLKNMFSNTDNPFSDVATSTISIVGDELNASDTRLRNAVASSRPADEAEIARTRIEGYFDDIAEASQSVQNTASQGVAGKLGNYLVDERGIEINQIIQKSLIGALQLDYIGNVLLNTGLNADNVNLVNGENYTALEHNWDEAYGLLTLNPIYLEGATDDKRNSIEFGAGAYIWEYNKANYAEIFPAFVKGRAAVVNNDNATMQAQALFIRTQFEKAIANAALGYLDKWKTGSTDATRAHAIGEGAGFIYSLRFATVHQADAAFSEGLLQTLVGSTNGFWDLDVSKINTVSEAIKSKFNLQ